jgi:short-subunit dehydrogenase
MTQTILITGASRGIGLATARLLQQQGHTVIGTCRNPAHADVADVELVALDVTQSDSIDACLHQIQHKGRTIDVLINNAGYDLYGAAEEVGFDELYDQVDTNFLGAVRMTLAVLPQMRARRAGKILNISSIGGLLALPYNSAYAASKFALEGFSESLRYEMLPFGVFVSLVEPGSVQTGTLDRSLVSPRTSHPAYHAPRAQLMQQMQQLAANDGITLEQLSHTIARIVATPYPALRYPVGGLARFMPFIKHTLPQRWFEAFIMRRFGASAA